MTPKTTASPSQGAREIAEKLATHPNGEVEPFFTRRTLIAEAANLIDAELAKVLPWLNTCEHDEDCCYWDGPDDKCDCGLAALLERFTPGK